MIEVKSAGKKGRGMFAIAGISKGTVIEQSPYIHIPLEDFEDIEQTTLHRYWFHVNSRACAIGLGHTSLYNHSKKPNAEWFISPRTKTIKIKALRDIRKNQEITIDYGYEVK